MSARSPIVRPDDSVKLASLGLLPVISSDRIDYAGGRRTCLSPPGGGAMSGFATPRHKTRNAGGVSHHISKAIRPGKNSTSIYRSLARRTYSGAQRDRPQPSRYCDGPSG